MTPTNPIPEAESKTWAVHRQDDNGNEFVVKTGLSLEEAEQLVSYYTAKGHKQLYWTVAEKST